MCFESHTIFLAMLVPCFSFARPLLTKIKHYVKLLHISQLRALFVFNVYLTKYLLNQKSTKNVYFSFIRSYVNYGKIASGSTSKTKLKKVFTYQKKTARVTFFAGRLAHAKPLMLDMNALNVYQINVSENLILLYKAQIGTAPSIFFNKFSKINHNYLASSRYSGNYSVP